MLRWPLSSGVGNYYLHLARFLWGRHVPWVLSSIHIQRSPPLGGGERDKGTPQPVVHRIRGGGGPHLGSIRAGGSFTVMYVSVPHESRNDTQWRISRQIQFHIRNCSTYVINRGTRWVALEEKPGVKNLMIRFLKLMAFPFFWFRIFMASKIHRFVLNFTWFNFVSS